MVVLELALANMVRLLLYGFTYKQKYVSVKNTNKRAQAGNLKVRILDSYWNLGAVIWLYCN